MLNNTQNETQNTWVNLLKCFATELTNKKEYNETITYRWQEIDSYFSTNIMNFDESKIDLNQVYNWQTWQIETHRLMRLLKTDLLFFANAKQEVTKNTRLASIQEKLKSAIQLTENLSTKV